MMSTVGTRKPGPLIWLPFPTMRTPNRNSADPANELPRTRRMLDMKTGSPSEKTRRPQTPRSVISRMGFIKIDRAVWMTTRHLPRRILRRLGELAGCGHLTGDANGLCSWFFFCKLVISIMTYPMGLRIASEIGAMR